MKLAVVALCDRATIREGLLHMLGGGVTQVALPFMPASPDVDLALLLTADDYREFAGAHKVAVSLVRAGDDQTVAALELQWEGPENVELPGDVPSPTLPLSVPIRGMAVAVYGMYRVTVSVDGKDLAALPLLIKAPDETFDGVTPQI